MSVEIATNGDVDGIVGGTFDCLHDGHKALLATAFQNADFVTVGVMADEQANEARERDVRPYIDRKADVEEVCATFANIFDTLYRVVSVDDGVQMAIDAEADVMVVSPEEKTQERATEINRARVLNGDSPLQLLIAPTVTGVHGEKISSTRIRNGEIDEHGNPLAVANI